MPVPTFSAAGVRCRVPLLLGLLCAVLLAGCSGGSDPAAPKNPGRSVGTSLDGPVAASISALPFTTSSGEHVSLASYKDKVVVISDSMTLCQEDCPLDTANVVTAARAADAAGLSKKVVFLTITVDPARDSPARLRKYRAMYTPAGSLPNWQLLTGSKDSIDRLWKYLGVYFRRVPEDSPPSKDWLTGKPLTYDVQHSDEVIAIDSHGHERFVISGHAHVASHRAVPSQMRTFLSPSGRRHLNRPGPEAWTSGDVLKVVAWLTGHPVSGSAASADG